MSANLTGLDQVLLGWLDISTGDPQNHIAKTFERHRHPVSMRDKCLDAIEQLSPAGFAFFAANISENQRYDYRRNGTVKVRELFGAGVHAMPEL